MSSSKATTEKKASNHYVDNRHLFDSLVEWQKELRKANRKKLPKPPIPDYVAECMMKIANRLSQRAGFVNYCFDEQTEILTRRGWLSHEQATTDDIVLAFDPEDGHLKWSPVYEIYRAPYDGMMFHLTGNGLDALVTPHHRFVTQRGFVYVEELQQRDNILLCGKATVAPTEPKYSDAFVKLVGWAATEGSYYTGKHSNRITIAQTTPSGIADIEQAFEDSGAPIKKHVVTVDSWRTYTYFASYNAKGQHTYTLSGALASEIMKCAVGPRKVLTQDFIDDLTYDQRVLLIETMIHGDGHQRQRSDGTIARFYYQKDLEHVGAFTSLCFQVGLRTTMKWRTVEGPFGKTSCWFVTLCDTRHSKWGTDSIGAHVENIDFHGSKRDLRNADHARGDKHALAKLSVETILEAKLLHSQGVSFKKLGEKYGVSHSTIHRAVTGQRYNDTVIPDKKEHQGSTPYKGTIWCPRTKYETVVVRRNGKTYVGQNSFKDDMVGDALESCLRYIHNFNPKRSSNAFAYITQIIHNAFIRRIQKEQKQLYVKMRIVDEADFTESYERQDGDTTHYNNSYVTYLQENKGEIIAKFENWKETKKMKASAKKKAAAELTGLFEEEPSLTEAKQGLATKNAC